MSRLADDACTRHLQLSDNVSSFHHAMDPCRYVHDSPCRSALGLVGGNDVPLAMGGMSDVASELRGQNYESSRCPAFKALPGAVIRPRRLHKPEAAAPAIDTSRAGRLPTCQIVPGLLR